MKTIIAFIFLSTHVIIYCQQFTRDTIYLSAIQIEAYGPEPVLTGPYSNDVALVIDTTKHPVVTVSGQYDPVSDYIAKSITYPLESIFMGIQGNIYAGFMVETNGSISNAKILKGVDKMLDSLVIKIILSMPRFKSTSKETYFIAPLKFRIENAITHNKRLAKHGELNGDWKCVQSDRYIKQEYYEPDIKTSHLRIIEDSLWYFEYPCCYYGLGQTPNNYVWNSTQSSWFQYDTLVIYNKNFRNGGFWYYLKDTFDQNIINHLINDTIYFPSLFGKWYLETEYPDEIEFGPPIKIKYP